MKEDNDIKEFRKLLSKNEYSPKIIEEILKWYDYREKKGVASYQKNGKFGQDKFYILNNNVRITLARIFEEEKFYLLLTNLFFDFRCQKKLGQLRSSDVNQLKLKKLQ